MKTTVEISDGILDDARRLAERDGTTVRALIESGLRREIRERARSPRFKLRRASFKGRGLQPEVAAAGWERVRGLAYEGRGE
jgi:hypothetical protein